MKSYNNNNDYLLLKSILEYEKYDNNINLNNINTYNTNDNIYDKDYIQYLYIKKQNKLKIVNAINKNKMTPLHLCNNYDFAKLLIENGAFINSKDVYGNTPLHYSTKYEITELLLQNNADPNIYNKCGNIPLHNCSDPNMAILLLNYGSNIHHMNMFDKTPLMNMILLNKNKKLIDLMSKLIINN